MDHCEDNGLFLGLSDMKQINGSASAGLKKKRKILAALALGKSVVYAFAIFGILFILLLVFVYGMLRQEVSVSKNIPENAVLMVNFNDDIQETRGNNLLSELSESGTLSYYDIIKAINLAAMDKNITAMATEINSSNLGLAQIEGLRKVIQDFRTTGKKAYIFSSGFGSIGGGISEYYLASVFDEIWMQPNSDVGITGIGIEVPFGRNLLDKIGAKPEFYTRYEYKTAYDSLMNVEMSSQYREELQKLGSGIFEQLVMDASSSRKLAEEEMIRLVNEAPLSAEEALNAELIDKIGYRQEMLEAIGGNPLDINRYAATIGEGNRKLPAVAFVVAEGMIDEGNSAGNPLKSEAVIGSRSFVEQLDEIAKNKQVKALVLRISSPGGSYTASNEMWYALKNFKEKNKIPVVVSMGDYAASGGYFVALAGDAIVAEPLTITGSIGVLGGKMTFSGLWEKLGVNWEPMYFGENAGILSTSREFSEKEKASLNKSLDSVYKDFTLKVSQARKLDAATMDNLARGRIWLGRDAIKNGLIDYLGGIDVALAIAKEKGGIKPAEKFTMLYYPKQKSLQEKIAEVIGGTPKIAVNQLKSELGLDIHKLNMLKRLQYNLALPPLDLKM